MFKEMNEMDKEINNLILREVGFEVGTGNKIYDQDTGMPVRINGLQMMAPGSYIPRQSLEFDPYNNRKLMGQIFNYFIDKQSEEGGPEVITYYNKDDTKDGGKVECRFNDNTTISSNQYGRDTLKYADLIMRLNGDDNPDLSKYDVPIVKETVVKKTTRKR